VVARLVMRTMLVASVLVALATMAAASAPPDLLPSPARPFDGYGSPAVRIESPTFPRYATGADGVRVRVERVPRRIVSMDSQADEFLAAVVPPERIVGVSQTAFKPSVSNVLGLVRRQRPVAATNVEAVLLTNPDLVISPMSAAAEQVGLLRHAGVPVYRLFTMFDTLDSIEAHIRLFGYLTGEAEHATTEIQRFRGAIERAVAMRPEGIAPPRVLGLGGAYSYGRNTLFTDILRRLGAENLASTHGLLGYDRVSAEQIVEWDPEWIVAGAAAGHEADVRAQLLRQPAIAATRAASTGRIVIFDNRVFLPLSPNTSRLVEGLADALYGGRRWP
jgi:ABC-type hemin transport system substrate-binding protein